MGKLQRMLSCRYSIPNERLTVDMSASKKSWRSTLATLLKCAVVSYALAIVVVFVSPEFILGVPAMNMVGPIAGFIFILLAVAYFVRRLRGQ